MGASHVKRRTLSPAWRGAGTLAVGAASLALLLVVASPAKVIDQIGRMNIAWALAAVVLELCSCLSYVVIFRHFFPEASPATSRRVAWIAMGAGAILPGGNISSAAATGLVMRNDGLGTRRLIGRCASLLCLLTGVGFALNGVAGLLLLLGVPDGPLDLSHTGIPIAVSVAVLGGAALVVVASRHWSRLPRPIRAVASGLEGAWVAVVNPSWRLLGAAGFLCLDMAALWATCAATGHRIGMLAVLIAYCIGYLATALPIPAGLGVLDSGLTAALVLYGLPATASVGAVLVYHAISIWVPGLGGLLAWLTHRNALVPTRATPGLAPLAGAPATGSN